MQFIADNVALFHDGDLPCLVVEPGFFERQAEVLADAVQQVVDVLAQRRYRPVEKQVVHAHDAVLVGDRDDNKLLAVAFQHRRAQQFGAGVGSALGADTAFLGGPAALTQAGIHQAVFLHHFSRQATAGNETRVAVVREHAHCRGAGIHQLDEGVEEAFQQFVEIARLAEARGDIIKDIQGLGFACETHSLGMHMRVHFHGQRFQFVTLAVDVLRQLAKLAAFGDRDAGREIAAAQAPRPVTQVRQGFHEIAAHTRDDQPEKRKPRQHQ